jgi:glyoxylase-like metal-dependent hydrolase (beta-lactamase superfamily II)
VVATPGHTPGHSSHAIVSGDQRAIILGDAVHCPIEFAEPSLRFTGDSDPDRAYRTRVRIAREFSGRGTVIIGPHFPEPVFGHLDGPELPQTLQPLMPPPDGGSVIFD